VVKPRLRLLNLLRPQPRRRRIHKERHRHLPSDRLARGGFPLRFLSFRNAARRREPRSPRNAHRLLVPAAVAVFPQMVAGRTRSDIVRGHRISDRPAILVMRPEYEARRTRTRVGVSVRPAIVAIRPEVGARSASCDVND
jgi:hypothetical protein